eukprot:g33518.t1
MRRGLLPALLLAVCLCLAGLCLRRAAAPCEAFTGAARAARPLPAPMEHSSEYDPSLDDLSVEWMGQGSLSARGCGFCIG